MTGTLEQRLADRIARAATRGTAAVVAVAPRPHGSPPLSNVQRRMWFLHQWSPLSAAYTMPIAWELRGRLDVDRLRGALSAVVARHEILRTRYLPVDGEPIGVVDAAAPVPLPVHELRGDPAVAVAELAGTPFDLATEQPIRATLLRHRSDRHILVICLHHIAADGWSVGLLAADLAAAFAGGGPGRATELPPPSAQYADVTHARARGAGSGDLRAGLEYWTTRLDGAAPLLDLPTDRPRTAVPSDSGATFRFVLDEELTAAVRERAARTRASTSMVLLAAVQAACARYADTDDVLVGLPVARRTDAPDVVGNFLDTIVVRTRVERGITGEQLVERVRHEVLDGTAFSHVPFDQVVAQRRSTPGHHPLYQVQFVATNVPRRPLRLDGLDVVELTVDATATKVDLSLAAEDDGAATIALTATYSTDLFDRASIERFAHSVRTLLAGMTARPTESVHALALVQPPPPEIPPATPDRLLTRIDGLARTAPDRVAVDAPDGTLTWAELVDAAAALVPRLHACGINGRAGGVVGVRAAPSTSFLVAVLACWQAGAAYVPLDPALPAQREHELLAAAGAAVCIDETGVRRTGHVGEPASDLAYVMFTSGSTGRPKGVAVTHANLAEYLGGISRVVDAGCGAEFAVYSTLAADLGHTAVFGALWSGGTVRLFDPDVVADADALARRLRERPVDIAKIVPSHLAALLSAADAAAILPRRCLVLGGEALSQELVDAVRVLRPDLRVVNHYGPTETTVGVLTYDVPLTGEPGPPGSTVPIGRPLRHVHAEVLDAGGQHCPVGVPGELHVSGPAVALGYWREPGLTAERFHRRPDGLRSYHTGDRVRRQADGNIEFLGRIDRQVKIRGHRVEPGEVEALLRAQPGVADAAVEVVDGRLVGYVVGPVRGLAERLTERVPAHLVPDALVELDELPLTANGKVDRSALPGPWVPAATGRAPRGALERGIARVFADVLAVPVSGADDDFFALGGHSLLATKTVMRLRRDLGVKLAVPSLFTHRTVAALARHIGTLRRVAHTPLRPGDGPHLSAAQRRLWVLDQIEPGNPAYNLPYAVRIEGPLDVAALQAALAHVVDRHDILRTVFPAVDGEPVARLHPPVPLSLPVVDLRGRAEADVRVEIDAEFRVGFDLANGPLVRTRLLRVADDAYVLLLTAHHIVFDGWSYAVFCDEVASVYTGARLPAPPLQCGDHARWQEGADHSGDLAHWRAALDGAPPWLDLPADRLRPRRLSHAGGARPVEVPPQVSEALLGIGRAEGATAFMTLLAAYQVLLARYAGVDDVVVGVPTAGRNHPDAEDMIGFFVNMLPIRGRPAARTTFREHLRAVRDTSVAAFGHSDLPFEQLVAELAPARDTGRTPVFSTMFALQNMPTPAWHIPGLSITPVDGPTGVAKYDLSLILVEHDEGLRGALEFSADLFTPETAGRIVGCLNTLLGSIAADPDRPIGELDLLPEQDRHRVLVEWNATAVDLPATPVPSRIAELAQRAPHAVAVTDAATNLTYAELVAAADRIAAALRERGVGPDSVVGVALDRSAHALTALLGVLRSGGAYLPLDPVHPPERLRYLLADSGAVALITDSGRPLPGLEFDGPVLGLDAAPVAPGGPGVVPRPEHLAYVIYTSGSTGRPKGVEVSHAALANLVGAIDLRLAPGPAAVFCGVTTWSFDMSVLELWLPLAIGARLDVVDTMTGRAGELLAQRIDDSGATHMQATPTTWRLLLDAGWTGNPGLTAICGGEPLPGELAAVLRSRAGVLWNFYGPTEATVWSTIHRVEAADEEISVGRPIANTTAYVLDETMRPVPIGVVGELYLGGAGLARGYRGRPDLTDAAFRPDPFGPGRLYRTGDHARSLPDGSLVLLGRRDGQVKLRGYRIEVGEVEMVLAEHSAVRAAAVAVRPDSVGEAQLIGYVVGRAEGVGTWLREQLPAHMVPTRIVELDALPVTPNGKLDRAALPRPAHERPPAGVLDRTDPALARVLAAFTEVLDQPIGPDDDFFAFGGDSMRAVRAVRRIDPALSVLQLFQHPTARELAARSVGRATAGELLHRMTARTASTADVTVLALPFGGAGAIVFRELATRLPATWALYAVQPPGRDSAHPDEAALAIEELADVCTSAILAERPGRLVLYGHCAGAALATAVATRLAEAGHPPLGIVVGAAFPTGRMPGPLGSLARLVPGRRLSDRLITDELRALGGLSEALPAGERRRLAAAIRHDAAEAERFYSASPARPVAPVLAVVGAEDKITEFHSERAHEWAAYGTAVDTAVIAGAGHFFTRDPDLAPVLREQVDRWLTGAPAACPPQVPPPANVRAFATVAAGQLVSTLGTALSTFALGLWALQATGAVSAFAAVAAFALVPAVLAAPFAGAVADRYDRRRVMIAADTAALAAAATAAALLTVGVLHLWHLYVVVGVGSVAAAFRQPAYLAAVAQLTPKRYLGQASGVVGLATAASTLLGPLVGGVLAVNVGVAGVVWIDVVSFAVSLGTLLVVSFPDLGFTRSDGPLLAEIIAGWRYVVRRRGLVALAVFFAVANTLGGVVVVLVTPLVLAFAPATTLGVVLAAHGAGLLAGSLVMAWWGGFRRRAAGMISFVGLFALSAVVIGLRPSVVFPVAGMFGIGVCAAMINAHWLALVQVTVRLDHQGRVMATCQMLARVVMPVGYLASGPLVDTVFEPWLQGGTTALDTLIGTGPGRGIAAVVILTGLVALGWSVVGFWFRPLREVDDLPPDDEPDAGVRGLFRSGGA
ncbi:non-ribosomal peptide synthetase/MFS transporter [Pseudonocardia sp. TRM90224]|uniref:non-ribosomal peptide synthetase/MFS transporter n=1 Tax=Pseudonocardia sp. TRM90224 TaxID=2812678 RepID=UPI001E3CC1B0|nr:non-ribosomal peptide synthetase [Pseudonocardia sp. TRM90224]